MSAGFHWNELVVPYSNPQNDAMVMHQRTDLIRYCLEKSVVKKPGEKNESRISNDERRNKITSIRFRKYEKLQFQMEIQVYGELKYKTGKIS